MDVVISDAAGNVISPRSPREGWDIGWSPDSSRVAVWDTLFETVGVYGVDGARHALVTMPSGWQPPGDHDPAWLRDGTLAVDDVEIPPDGGAARRLDLARFNEWRDDYLATVGLRVDSPDGSHTAHVVRGGRSLRVDGSDGSGSVTLLTVERGTSLWVIGFSPEGDRILFSREVDRKWTASPGRGQGRILEKGAVERRGRRLRRPPRRRRDDRWGLVAVITRRAPAGGSASDGQREERYGAKRALVLKRPSSTT